VSEFDVLLLTLFAAASQQNDYLDSVLTKIAFPACHEAGTHFVNTAPPLA
jgi:hypothetical protein